MLRATNCASNLMGTDRDEAVRKARVLNTQVQSNLPSAEDLDRVADEQRIAADTNSVQYTQGK